MEHSRHGEHPQDPEMTADFNWAQAADRVMLATSSPFVESFFEDLAREQGGSLAIHIVGVDASALKRHNAYLDDAEVAVVHSDPDLAAAEALCAVLEVSWPTLPIIVLVTSVRTVTPRCVSAMLRAEISGLVDLETSAAELLSTLRGVGHGRVRVSVSRDRVHAAFVAAALLDREPSQIQRRFLSLTTREQDVLELLTRGGTDKEISVRLGMSPSTVGNHVRSMQSKLGARTRVQLGLVVGQLEGARAGRDCLLL